MKAKLVYLSLVTRVVVEDDADWDTIVELARPKFKDKIQFERNYKYLENIDEVKDDLECPYEDPNLNKAIDCGTDKLIEIRVMKLNGIMYEVHVDATEERSIFEVFAESGEVTEEIRDALEEAVGLLDE